MLNIIVSPKANLPKAEKVTKTIVKYLKQQKEEYAVYFSLDLDDLNKNVKDIQSSGEVEYILVGNDETLNSFVNCFKDLTKIKFGIIPVGDGCDFADFLGLENNPTKAIQKILERKIGKVDYLQANDKRVLNNIIIGSSVETAVAYEQYKIKNSISRKIAEVNYGNKFEGVELSLAIKNDTEIKENVFELIIANGGLSNGRSVSPLSNMSDGLFNVNYSTADEPKEKKNFTKELNHGRHIYDEGVHQIWTDNLKVSHQDKNIKALVDGVYTTFEEINISIVEAGLRIYK